MLTQVLVTLLAGGMFAGAFAVGRTAFLRRLLGRSARPSIYPPIPSFWRSILQSQVPLTRRLTPAQRERLLQKMQQLIHGCRWEGCAGLRLTEDMQVVIAAHACLLVLEQPGDPYPDLDTVLIYPGTFRPRRFSWTPSADSGDDDPALGESWKHGVVILAWDSTLAGAADPRDGQNVVLHEFAHQLDMASGQADGTPRLPNATALSSWSAMLERDFERLSREAEAGSQGVLDHYGATNPAEFFAVATEAFFERPAELQRERPVLYDALRDYYRQDLAATAASGETASSTSAPDMGLPPDVRS
ncbi:MAG: zinc-dependent peptidase [Gemmatimonadales bacterium]